MLSYSIVTDFNPLPPHGGRPADARYRYSFTEFQSTPSAWRETLPTVQARRHLPYFNPLPPHGGRLMTDLFTPSPGRYFNPLPPHGGRPVEKAAKEVAKAISIHSLRMEGDCSIDQRSHAVIHFNPLPPHGGRRSKSSIADLASYFNPLPPHGGRRYPCRKNKSGEHFNPLPPHGGRLPASVEML